MTLTGCRMRHIIGRKVIGQSHVVIEKISMNLQRDLKSHTSLSLLIN